MRISDWSSDVCSSDLAAQVARGGLMLDQAQQRVPVAVEVHQDDRLVVQLELTPGDDLEGLVQGAEAAGQRAEGVGAPGHALLAIGRAMGRARRCQDG